LTLVHKLPLTLSELKAYQKAHAKYAEKRQREIQAQSEAKIQAIREESKVQEKAYQEQWKHEREETEQRLREIFAQGRAKMAQRPKEEDEQIIEGEILSSEEVNTPKEEQ